MTKNGAVAVVFGGDSAERDVSVITGTLCANLLKAKRPVLPVFIDVDKRAYTSPKMFSPEAFNPPDVGAFFPVAFYGGGAYAVKERKSGGKFKFLCGVDCILNCCHGGESEGGGVAAVASAQNIPLASPDMFSSALSMDKEYSVLAAKAHGVPVVNGFTASKGEFSDGVILSLADEAGYPLIVKPARAGSSIGVCTVKDGLGLLSALKTAFSICDKAVVERYIEDKKEVSCAVYEGKNGVKVSPAVITYSGGGVYGFDKKYGKGAGRNTEILDGEEGELIREYSRRIYSAFSLFGMVRTDFLLGGGTAYFCEVNSVPGSLCYGFFTKRFSVQRDILEEIISLAILRAKEDKKKKVITDIINKNEKIALTCCKM